MSCWYGVSAPQDDIAVSTRIRLARNINGIPFPSKMTPEQFKTVNVLVKKAILPYFMQERCLRTEKS